MGLRAASLTLEGEQKPDMASLTLGSVNFSSEASVSAPSTVMRLAAIMQERGIRPEPEVFDLGMVNFAKVLIDKD
ncbi:MAG: 3-keto-5-aminohexanoate cleavage protein [Sulfuritalea sp.]|nr:3-keto-5-aminohexanoate cleavage protein [Sulfuritalea sp.]